MKVTSLKCITSTLFGALLGLLVLMGASCKKASTPSSISGVDTETASTLESIKADKVIRVGFANEAPYAYEDSETGKLTGEAPEILRHLLAEIDPEIKMEGVLVEFGSLIPALKAGRMDIIAAGMYIKPERCMEIDFSNPTYAIGEGFLVQKGNPKKLHSYEDIKAQEKAIIGVVGGAVEEGYAKAVGIPDKQIKIFPDADAAVAGVRAGRCDAYAGTALTVQDKADKDNTGKVERALPFTDPVIDGSQVKGYGAFGFRKTDTDLRMKINELLADFIGSEAHGELVRSFGFTKSELPGEVTAEQLCSGDTTQ